MANKNSLRFDGSGGTLFGLTIVNTLLTLITLGLYYPWAKVKYLKYYYQNFYMSGDHFSFHGTGEEIFKGFIKGFLILVVLFLIYGLFIFLKIPAVGALLYFVGLMSILPIAVHGTYRYRMAKTSWRSIFFGYRGNLTELIKLFWKGLGLTLVTFGIYSFWFEVNLNRYIFSNIRLGNIKLNFKGDGFDYFLLNLKGMFLSMITLGIYSFWFYSDLFRYYIENLEAEHNGQTYQLDSDVSAGRIFNLYFVNLLIIIFTLGLGFAWAKVREMEFLAENITIPAELDTDNIEQTEKDYQDATGEGMFDFLDLNIIF